MYRSVTRHFAAGSTGSSRLAACLSLACAAVPGVGSAHHSFAMYDESKAVEVVGTVAKFSWSNPHVVFWVVSVDKNKVGTVWTIESPFGPAALVRYGWTRATLKVGDKVDLWISPLRDGKHGGSLQSLTFIATGRTLYDGSRGSHGGLDKPASPPRAARVAPAGRLRGRP